MPSLVSRFDAKRTAFLLGAEIVIAIALLLHVTHSPPPASNSAGVLALPDLTFTDVQGKRERLAAYRGRPLFVNMWATWCPPCRAEIPDLERLYTEKKTTGFAVIGVDQGQEAAPVSSFVSDYRLTYPVLLDQSQQLSSALGTNGLPTTLVYDRAGRLVDVVTGMMSPDVMQAEWRKATEE